MNAPRNIIDDWFEQIRAEVDLERQTLERSSMSEEQLMNLRQQIKAARERGSAGENVREVLLELRRSHFRENGASGG